MDEAIATVTIGSRFNGPPTTGNGGYVCGRLGRHLGVPAEVTLRVPPPLERPLAITRQGDALALHDDERVVAEAVPATVTIRPPALVSLDDAEQAVDGYAGFTDHLFPTCFVCGPKRSPGDGLRLFPGRVAGTPVAAAPWTPLPDLADRDGRVLPEIVWAALDCPSYFGGVAGVAAVLGRLAVDLRAPVAAGEPHVVLGWSRGSEGRKHFAAAAVTTTDGEVLAVSRATWVQLRQPPPTASL